MPRLPAQSITPASKQLFIVSIFIERITILIKYYRVKWAVIMDIGAGTGAYPKATPRPAEKLESEN
jgi:hypothetical protein